ncbi:hypothetical protein C6P45_002717 [Maudiozyma exigua]|uniref:PSP proline-rich domain-containing protein n=1 Tax=Maudiozyma exigua TaxID=34358 RepID=A0A9P6VUX3_MAUEX|nr:hypothetical protein C6P45_002717 [Kazachstania exigua]
MARRAGNKNRKNKTKVNAGNINDTKNSIAELIDTRNKTHKVAKPVKKQKKKAVGNKSLNVNLVNVFSDVIKKFEAQDPTDAKDAVDSSDEVLGKELVNITNTQGETQKQEEIKQNDNGPSRKKLRKQNKPTLSELKSSVIHPEVIEWYDCDAPYPQLLAYVKSQKNVVPVPSHWQTKREYLSGRSLLSKKPFELPDIIKMTDIEQMRSTLPSVENERSLKELSRATVQPKASSLDIDYKKIYNIFFKIGAKWKQDLLLPFGDMYYENRNLGEESQWRKMKKDKMPGQLSKGLRDAMGLEEGQLPPWCTVMNEVGMPPAYPDMKIAGINWDISNLKDDTYAKVTQSNGTSAKRSSKNYFGTIISFEKNDPLEDVYERTIDEKKSENAEATVTENKKQVDDNVISLTEYEAQITVPSSSTVTNLQGTGDEENKPLYKVIEINEKGDRSNVTASTTAYKLDGVTQSSSANKTSKQHDTHEEDEDEELQNFKF